jgi:hypothetical protein
MTSLRCGEGSGVLSARFVDQDYEIMTTIGADLGSVECANVRSWRQAAVDRTSVSGDVLWIPTIHGTTAPLRAAEVPLAFPLAATLSTSYFVSLAFSFSQTGRWSAP